MLKVKLLKSIVKGVKLYENSTFTMDFITSKRVNNEDIIDKAVEPLFASVYKHNLIAISGINASGKTSTLKLLSTILELFIQNKTLATLSHIELFEQMEDTCVFINYFYDGNNVYELISKLHKNEEGKFYFLDETLKEKKISSNMSKSKIFDFESIKDVNTREEIEKKSMGYLRDDTSIFMSVLKKNNMLKGTFVYDMMNYTNFNIFAYLNRIPSSYIQYLDPTIDFIDFSFDRSGDVSDLPVKIKFQNQELKEIPMIDLWKYLSSGTIKGINLLLSIQQVLKYGGYLVIDELENHLNKTVAITIMNLFKSDLNSNNATLIFSTHYSELLDDIERSDSIYFSNRNDGKISFARLSEFVTRSDKKKSNIYLSGVLGTAPKYSAYQKLKESLAREINNDLLNYKGKS